MPKEKRIKLMLPESAVRTIREALDHHAKALVWRINHSDDKRAVARDQGEVDQTNKVLTMVEMQTQINREITK